MFTLPWLSHGISCSSRYYCVTEEVKYISMEEIPGAHLNTTAIKKHAVKSVPQCQQFCVKEDKCRSINLIGNKTNGYDCHLLDLNKFSNSTLVVMNETFSHLYIPVCKIFQGLFSRSFSLLRLFCRSGLAPQPIGRYSKDLPPPFHSCTLGPTSWWRLSAVCRRLYPETRQIT